MTARKCPFLKICEKEVGLMFFRMICMGNFLLCEKYREVEERKPGEWEELLKEAEKE
jgi:hypothetical protein